MLENVPTPTGLTAHLLFMAIYIATAAAGLTGALLSLVRRETAGNAVRVCAILTAVGAFAAVLVGATVVPRVPASDFGWDAQLVTVGAALALAISNVVLAITVAEPRTAALATLAGALTGSGLLVHLLLYSAAPSLSAAMNWELKRLSVYAGFAGLEALLFALLGATVSLRPLVVSRTLHAVAFVAGGVAVVLAMSVAGASTLSQLAVVAFIFVPAFFWFLWLMLRARPPVVPRAVPGADRRTLDRLAHRILSGRLAMRARLARFAGSLRRLPERRSTLLLASLMPLGLAVMALFFGSGDTAREAARVNIGGVAFTPALLVPFAFAPALGLILGSPNLRARGLWGLGLTFMLLGLLAAQKEIGYSGVVVAVAAAAFLAARGTLLHLVIGGAFGLLAVAIAFELQPVLPWIPFTVRERILLWLGAASFVRRGGHLLMADRVTYDVGGFWGIGVDTEAHLDLHNMVNSLDTDFPLAVVGLFGGMPWLVSFIVLFVALALLLFDIARRDSRRKSFSTTRWRLPTLIGLATVPIASTAINLSGGTTQLTPFTGVPAAFLSYSSFFLGGTLVVVMLFFVAGNDGAVVRLLRRGAEIARPKPKLDPALLAQVQRTKAPEPWWENLSWAGLRLFGRRQLERVRTASVDAGAFLLMGGLAAASYFWIGAIYDRYADRPAVHAHPALTSHVRVRPLVPGTWEVVEDTIPGWRGILSERRQYRLDNLEMHFKGGTLEVTGACFPWLQSSTRGVSLGFDGLMKTHLAGFDGASRSVASRLGARIEQGNDLVLPLAPVWLRHATVTRVSPGWFRVESATPGARYVVLNARGKPVSDPMDGPMILPAGTGFALADDRRLRFRIDDVEGDGPASGETCLRSFDKPMFTWPLDPWRHTLVGGPRLLRRAPIDNSIDFEFAEDLKRAAEHHLVGVRADGTLWVAPWDRATREAWDPITQRVFARAFRVKRFKTDDGGVREELHWIRRFYFDGGSKVRADAELDAFASSWTGHLAGLADPFRFSLPLPTTAAGELIREAGTVMDAKNRPLAYYVPEEQRFEVTVPQTGTILGWGFTERGIFGGTLRVFRRLLMGRLVRPVGIEAELTERILDREATFIGADVMLTLDAELQAGLQKIVDEECAILQRGGRGDYKARGRALILGPHNEIVAMAQCPGVDIRTLEQAEELVRMQKEQPYEAPALDVLHRTVTVGSTAKVGMVVAAARDPKKYFKPYDKKDICIRADDDPGNSSRGCFREPGLLTSVKGEKIAPVKNFAGAGYGGVTTIRQLLVKSINTASAYLAGRLGLAEFQDFYDLVEMTRPYDLVPDVIGKNPKIAIELDRWHGDPLTAWRARLGELPPGPDYWRMSYDVRLALSGFSDFSMLHVGVATGIIARDGIHYRPYMVRGIRDLMDGQVLKVDVPSSFRVIASPIAGYLKSAMVDTVDHGTAGGMRGMLPPEVWKETGGKTGTGETVRLIRGGTSSSGNVKSTQDHKFFTGFWPASSATPYVVVTGFEYASHIDTRVAVRCAARAIDMLAKVVSGPTTTTQSTHSASEATP